MIDQLVEQKLGPPAIASALLRKVITRGFHDAAAAALVTGEEADADALRSAFETKGVRPLNDELIVSVWDESPRA